LKAIGIPTSMFTVMFAMSRTVGWVSQWNEMVSEGQMRIGRPRQLYVGQSQREYALSSIDSPSDAAETSADFSKVMAEKEVADILEGKPDVSAAGKKLYNMRRKASTSFKMELPDVPTR